MSEQPEARRSGRPLGFDRAEALARLMTLFWQVGFERVTQQQMATVTGLSTSSLYNSFGTKTEIYREAVADYLRRMRTLVEPLEEGDAGVADVLEMLTRMEAVLAGPYGGFGCLATTAMVTPVDDEVDRATRRYRERLRAGFAAAASRSRALNETTGDPTVLANVMTAAVLGTLTVARAAPGSPELAVQLRTLREFVSGWRDG